jgi:competence protein ComFC
MFFFYGSRGLALIRKLHRDCKARGKTSAAKAHPLIELGRMVELAFFPSFCKICGCLLENPGERVLCGICLSRIGPDRVPGCPLCGRFFDGVGESHLCGSCLAKAPSFSLHRSAGRYRGHLKDAVLLLKYKKFRPLGSVLGGMAFEALKKDEILWKDIDLIIPVPLHKRRQRERGFNQAEAVAREIGKRSGIAVARKILRKTRNAPPQTSLERDDRANNVRDAFAVVGKEAIAGKVILLVDDVYTTGATLGACARILHQEGAVEVRAITVAQA